MNDLNLIERDESVCYSGSLTVGSGTALQQSQYFSPGIPVFMPSEPRTLSEGAKTGPIVGIRDNAGVDLSSSFPYAVPVLIAVQFLPVIVVLGLAMFLARRKL